MIAVGSEDKSMRYELWSELNGKFEVLGLYRDRESADADLQNFKFLDSQLACNLELEDKVGS